MKFKQVVRVKVVEECRKTEDSGARPQKLTDERRHNPTHGLVVGERDTVDVERAMWHEVEVVACDGDDGEGGVWW